MANFGLAWHRKEWPSTERNVLPTFLEQFCWARHDSITASRICMHAYSPLLQASPLSRLWFHHGMLNEHNVYWSCSCHETNVRIQLQILSVLPVSQRCSEWLPPTRKHGVEKYAVLRMYGCDVLYIWKAEVENQYGSRYLVKMPPSKAQQYRAYCFLHAIELFQPTNQWQGVEICR